MTEQIMSELDKLAYDAYRADWDAQGIHTTTQWNELNTLTQKRYRAIAHLVYGHFTSGWMSATQLEKSLIAEMVLGGSLSQRLCKSSGSAQGDR